MTEWETLDSPTGIAVFTSEEVIENELFFYFKEVNPLDKNDKNISIETHWQKAKHWFYTLDILVAKKLFDLYISERRGYEVFVFDGIEAYNSPDSHRYYYSLVQDLLNGYNIEIFVPGERAKKIEMDKFLAYITNHDEFKHRLIQKVENKFRFTCSEYKHCSRTSCIIFTIRGGPTTTNITNAHFYRMKREIRQLKELNQNLQIEHTLEINKLKELNQRLQSEVEQLYNPDNKNCLGVMKAEASFKDRGGGLDVE